MGRMILACIGLAVLSPTLLAAQTTPTVSPGDTIRIRTGPGTPWMVRTVLALQESELVVSDDTGALTVPFSAIAELEVHRPDPFDTVGRMALHRKIDARHERRRALRVGRRLLWLQGARGGRI